MTAKADAALVSAYSRYLMVCGDADQAVREEHEGLLRAARRIAGGLGRAGEVVASALDESAGVAAEASITRHPVSTGAPAISVTDERELRDEVGLVAGRLHDRFEQLWRMHGRGPLGARPVPSNGQLPLARSPVRAGWHVCAVCSRDHRALWDDELVLDETGRAVCWICGDEHDPRLTAEVLATAVDNIEQGVSQRVPGYFEHWSSLLRAFGLRQHANDLDCALARHKEQVRRLKEARLGDPDVWLGKSPE